jgi:amino-acid N-acetyltransferase
MSQEERKAPSRVRITGLQEAQLAALVELETACSEMYWAQGFDAAEVPARTLPEIVALTKKHDVHVAEADEVVAGYLAWRDEAPGVAYIEEISVHPDFQRFGIATQLFAEMADKASAHGIGEVILRAWTKATWAQGFYRQAGFREVDAAAPERVRQWALVSEGSARPRTRPGEVLLWAPVAPLRSASRQGAPEA